MRWNTLIYIKHGGEPGRATEFLHNGVEFGCSLFNPLKAELNPICHLLALLGAHHILHVGRIRVK